MQVNNIVILPMWNPAINCKYGWKNELYHKKQAAKCNLLVPAQTHSLKMEVLLIYIQMQSPNKYS